MKYLITGGWAAGTAAAQHLRKLDPSSEITVVDAESVAYYPRPDLIEYLAGRKSGSRVKLDVQLLPAKGSVSGIVVAADGTPLASAEVFR